ncbi:MAG: hypothetical protein NT069_16575 [Planctomycetota bacterium]|nr:hypothetical protein [Planctomycetota bacterium]
MAVRLNFAAMPTCRDDGGGEGDRWSTAAGVRKEAGDTQIGLNRILLPAFGEKVADRPDEGQCG